METRLVKGTYVSACTQFTEKFYNQAQRDKISAQLSPEVRAGLPTVTLAGWYPLPFATEQLRGIFQSHQDLDEAEAAVRRCGKFIGEQATGTFLKLLMKVLTMNMMVRKWADFWLKYHNFGTTRAELPGPNRMTLYITPGYEFIYQAAAGWVDAVCGAMNLKDVIVKTNVPRGQTTIEEVRLDVTWS